MIYRPRGIRNIVISRSHKWNISVDDLETLIDEWTRNRSYGQFEIICDRWNKKHKHKLTYGQVWYFIHQFLSENSN